MKEFLASMQAEMLASVSAALPQASGSEELTPIEVLSSEESLISAGG